MGPTAEVTRDYDHDWIRQANAAQALEPITAHPHRRARK